VRKKRGKQSIALVFPPLLASNIIQKRIDPHPHFRGIGINPFSFSEIRNRNWIVKFTKQLN